jgi:hypothetical protein
MKSRLRSTANPRCVGIVFTFACVFVAALILAHTDQTAAQAPVDAAPQDPGSGSGPASTIVDGDITANATWTKTGSPYEVTTDISVVAGATLTVEPGVEVRFRQYASMDVAGTLIAIGTVSEGITFTGTTAQPGWWDGISISGTWDNFNQGSMLDHVTIAYGGYGYGYANLYLYFATVTLTHSSLQYSGADGLYSHAGGVVRVSDTSFSGNQGYAVHFYDGSANPVLSHLTATNNGYDGVALGYGLLVGDHIWEAAGLPYYVVGDQYTDSGSTLTVEPGVEVRFDQYLGLDVAGTLTALGTASQPITFTGTTAQPGWWEGISIAGTSDRPNEGSVLDYVTIEYGGYGYGYANLYLYYARVAVSHSVLRYSGDDGLYASQSGGSVIELSQILDNADFGVENYMGSPILASYNWWGDASGPAHDACNAGGSGDRVSDGVVFKPFLASPDAAPGPLAPSDARMISLEPQRWFAPADDITRIWVEITLRDGNGVPLPGRNLRLYNDLLDRSVDAGITDIQGRTFAYVTSDIPGDAELTAFLDDGSTCEYARTASAVVTFADVQEGPLMPGAAAPYLNGGIDVEPLPIVRGVPSTLSALLTNPNDFSISVDASFSIMQFGVGLTFGPVGEVQDFVIGPHSDGVIAVPWTPAVSGHQCIEVQYSASRAGGGDPGSQVSGEGQRNLDVLAGPLGAGGAATEDEDPTNEKAALEKARKVTGAISNGNTVLDFFDSPIGAKPVGNFIPNTLFNCILDFNYNTWERATRALGGDPPRQDYQTYATLEEYTFTPLEPGEDLSPERAAAANALMEAVLDLTARLRAATISLDRYAGAAAAGDLLWASQQAAALIYYKQEAGATMVTVAYRLEALQQVMRDEGMQDLFLLEETFEAYQARLSAEGFSSEELQAARTIGLTDEEIETIRQERIAANPAEEAGNIMTRLEETAEALRSLGDILMHPPNFPSTALHNAGITASAENNLARIYESVSTFQVGNPLSETATVELRVRRVDLPSDWMVRVMPPTVVLSPSEQTTATVHILPGTAAVQGMQPRVAIEGYVNDQLIGGVAVDVMVPEYVPFVGRFRVYLPLVLRQQ